MKKILLMMFALLIVGGAKVFAETKTPIKLTGGHSGDYTLDQNEANTVITPLGTSTLENLYSATFTVTFSNISLWSLEIMTKLL